MLIKFPAEFKASDIKGTINFQRPSNNQLDFQIPINLTKNEAMIGNDRLVEGIWDVKIDWYVGKQTFLLKQTLSY